MNAASCSGVGLSRIRWAFCIGFQRLLRGSCGSFAGRKVGHKCASGYYRTLRLFKSYPDYFSLGGEITCRHAVCPAVSIWEEPWLMMRACTSLVGHAVPLELRLSPCFAAPRCS